MPPSPFFALAGLSHIGQTPRPGQVYAKMRNDQRRVNPVLAAGTAEKRRPGRPKGSTTKTGSAGKKPRAPAKTKAAAKKNKGQEEEDEDEDELEGIRTAPRPAKSAAVKTIHSLFADHPPPEDMQVDSDFEQPTKSASKGGSGKNKMVVAALAKPARATKTPAKAPAKAKPKPRTVVAEDDEEEDEIDELADNDDDGDDVFLPALTRPRPKPERTSARLRHEPAPSLSIPATRKRSAPKTKAIIADSAVELDEHEQPHDAEEHDHALNDSTRADGEPPRKKRATAPAKESLRPIEHLQTDHDESSSDTDDSDNADPHAAVHEPQFQLTQPLAELPRSPPAVATRDDTASQPSLARGPLPATPRARRAAGGSGSGSPSPVAPAPAPARLASRLPPPLLLARSQRAGSAVSGTHRPSSPVGSTVSDARRSSSPAPPPPPPPRAGSARPARPITTIAMSSASSPAAATVAPPGSKSPAADDAGMDGSTAAVRAAAAARSQRIGQGARAVGVEWQAHSAAGLGE
ncbi:hypothetical protein AMAG_08931 [Allomyces macrogynus ATCC 38327]|uniref:Uncharacterized protein n=1 Tax=Allomyces macrogynus (strain ATCC 38327) TaxID=578462 RepID=A0A0L0SMT6_ALLM3|nr:hypothetical protein AMAG_08931 [Allomyces macrogynus ATCC 38327]|eukprot:KNE63866.1 hypothetical protein AMAG_08931 [Allomyces macrogynus ATCC 38327]